MEGLFWLSPSWWKAVAELGGALPSWLVSREWGNVSTWLAALSAFYCALALRQQVVMPSRGGFFLLT